MTTRNELAERLLVAMAGNASVPSLSAEGMSECAFRLADALLALSAQPQAPAGGSNRPGLDLLGRDIETVGEAAAAGRDLLGLGVQLAAVTLGRCGAVIVDPANLPTRGQFSQAELEILLYEFKAGVNAYLKDHDTTALSLEYAILGLLSPDYRIEPWTPTPQNASSPTSASTYAAAFASALADMACSW